ncbi:MAG: J domain-containing protein [Eubacterium sp.]|nr:J domain-containing protein [Eubacterium sp.]
MTRREAYTILGITPEASKEEIKKRYRQLMLQVHPDSGGEMDESYAYSAREINIAYDLVNMGKFSQKTDRMASYENVDFQEKENTAGREKEAGVWNAPLNQNAYRKREVLCYAEDYDGTVFGNFCVAEGKYLWTPEEDFPLFLLSVYQCSKQLLDECDDLRGGNAPAVRPQVQAELTYLLAQQFIDATALLPELTKEETADENGDRIFLIPSMLELTADGVSLKVGDVLFPSGLRQHKLYLKDQTGREVGYLSFHDDRLYYIIVPLLGQRRVQTKIVVSEKSEKVRRNKTAGYRNLHMWIKLPRVSGGMPENLNLQIDKLLENYRKQRT